MLLTAAMNLISLNQLNYLFLEKNELQWHLLSQSIVICIILTGDDALVVQAVQAGVLFVPGGT